MIQKKFLFVSFLFALLIGFSACDEGDNYDRTWDYAIIGGHNSSLDNHRTITVSNNIFAAPDLDNNKNLQTGDCVYLNYTVDYDNQPQKNYWTATNIIISEVFKQKLLSVLPNGNHVYNDYKVPFENISCSYSPNYRGKMFVRLAYQKAKDEEVTYELFCNSADVSETGEINMYLRGKSNNPGTTQEKSAFAETYVFDAYDFISTYGLDKNLGDGAIFRSVNVIFNLIERFDDDGNPIYSRGNGGKSMEIGYYTK